MPKPRDAGVYETPLPDDFKIVGDDWAPLDGGGIPFAGHDKNFAPGSNPDNPQDMPADCPTPDGCRPNGCHGACLPQSEPTKPDMRRNFEEWARDAQELDTRHRDSDSPLDRQQYESWVTALAWEAWAAATYEAWSFLVHQAAVREGNVRVRDPWVDKDGQWWAVIDDGCTYPKCDCEQPEDAGCGRK